MKEEVHIDVLTRRQDDGRIRVVTVHPDGEILASFNTWPYRSIRISKEQFERYKPYLLKDYDTYEGIVEYWQEPKSDNGIPKFINNIFG